MTQTIETAACGCPIPPDAGESMGWHLRENHVPEELEDVRRSLVDLSKRVEQAIADMQGFGYYDDPTPTVAVIEPTKHVLRAVGGDAVIPF